MEAMIVYSKRIIQFVTEIKRTIKEILSKEIGLKVCGERFYDRRERVSYPLQVVIYNNQRMLGYFDPSFYELGFHECLMHSSKAQVHNVIRHELAHYMTFIKHGENVQAHGPEFRAFCQERGWMEEVYRATTCLEDGQEVSDLEENNVFRKIQKLMALASSSNKNEAEMAMIKSQQLLLKHNIDAKQVESDEEEKLYLKRILRQKKIDAKMRSIALILGTFFVNAVFSRAKDCIYLEILGNKVNIEIADYVAGFLYSELDKLWHQAQRQANLKGTIAKNSFFLGIAKGYCNKIHALKREYDSDVANALLVIEKTLSEAAAMVYRRLSSTRSGSGHCRASSLLGEKMGRQLDINPVVRNDSGLKFLT